MGAWTKIDELRTLVAGKPIVQIDAAPIKTLSDAQAALAKSSFAPDRLVVMNWEILLSRRRQDGVIRWHLSAKFHPNRSSTTQDWTVLGKIAARLGATQDPAVMPEDPRAAVHWSWIEE